MRRTEAFMLQNPPTSLFPVAESDAADDDGALVTPLVTPAPRFNMPERFQGEFRAESLDQRLDADHDARLVWKLVEGLDLSVLYHEIKAVEGQPGRNPSDPRVLFALWLYASLDGVGSARKLEKLAMNIAPTNGSAAVCRLIIICWPISVSNSKSCLTSS